MVGINEQIIQDLDSDYSNYFDEEALEAGIPYLKDFTDTYVREYSEAKDLVENVSIAISKEDIAVIRSANSDKRKATIQKYTTIKESIENRLFNQISSMIDQNNEKENLIYLMEEVIKFSPQKDKLKYQYSDYVANYCIMKVNAEELSNFQAIKYMKNAYLSTPKNPKVCKNIVTLIHFNLMDILNKNTIKETEIYRILDEIYKNRSEALKQNSKDLSDARTEILAQLRKAGVDTRLLEGKSTWGNETLSSEGIKLKKVLDYLNNFSAGYSSDPSEDRRKELLDLLLSGRLK